MSTQLPETPWHLHATLNMLLTGWTQPHVHHIIAFTHDDYDDDDDDDNDDDDDENH